MRNLLILAMAASLTACLSHPPPAAAPYRAVGQSTDWTLIIDDRFLTFIPAPGRQPILHPVRIRPVAHAIAAHAMDDVHVDPLRPIDFARDAVDDLWRRLLDRLGIGLREGQVMLVD